MRGKSTPKVTAELELTVNEKRVLLALDREASREEDQRSLSEKTGINEDAVMQTAFMLAQKGLCEIRGERKVYHHLTEEGKEYAEKGLPERRGLDLLPLPLPLQEFKNSFTDEKEANISTNWLLKKGWAQFEEKEGEKFLSPTGNTSWGCLGYNADEEFLRVVRGEGKLEESLLLYRVKERVPDLKDKWLNRILGELIKKRGLLEPSVEIKRRIAITETGKEVLSHGISVEEEIAQLTPELLRTGSWRGRKFKRYDVNLPSKEVFPAKIHPYQRILDRMRRIFTDMGFIEIKGEVVQSSFWNFDVLFVPQDHPAREMQDTFYLSAKKPIDASEELIKKVKQMHEHGGSLNSTGWSGE